MKVQDHSSRDILHSTFMKDLRQQFRDGEKPSGCSTCWVNERNGFKSKRLEYFDAGFASECDVNYAAEPDLPSEFQMIISNACNLKCRSCSPSHSTLWQKEISENYPQRTNYGIITQAGSKTGKLWTNRKEWYSSIRRLEIVGGEPFFIKQWHTIFDELIDAGLSINISLNMSTNCTIFPEDLLQKIIRNFKWVGIGLSVDGLGSTYEYLRHPGKWDSTFHNMRRFTTALRGSNNIGCQISHTIGWMNAMELPEFHTMAVEELDSTKIWHNVIHQPDHLALWAIPIALKNAIATKWELVDWKQYDETIKGIRTFMFSRDISDETFKQNIQITKDLDRIRNESLLHSIPALSPYISNYY